VVEFSRSFEGSDLCVHAYENTVCLNVLARDSRRTNRSPKTGSLIDDAIYLQARYHLTPQPFPAGTEMRSTEYYWTHNQMIEEQAHSLGVRLGELVSGDKKDVVITNLLASRVGRIAIYGWHRAPGDPIQPLSTVHGANYADYSHGIRLVSEMALIDGKLRPIDDILRDSSASRVLSDEGPIRGVLGLLSPQQDSPTVAAIVSK
jgi:hypothetical protein